MNAEIRPLTDRDFFSWLGLWEGYSAFYESELTDNKALTVWTWLMDKNHDLTGYVAADGEELVGLMHVRAYPRTLEANRALFLDDLYVTEDARSSGVGAALMAEAKRHARESGLSTLTWITAEDNELAQKLYDAAGERTTWVTYEASVEEN